jgi:hypothetical protein
LQAPQSILDTYIKLKEQRDDDMALKDNSYYTKDIVSYMKDNDLYKCKEAYCKKQWVSTNI